MPTATPKPDTKPNAAPRHACTFVRQGAVTFGETDGEKGNLFRIVGYSGEIIPDHWWWDNLAFDLNGLSFASDRTPVLDSHFTDRRLGFTTNQEIADEVTFDGRFLSNPRAQEFRQDMQEGFPMQASLYVPPSATERVKEGESVEVNGRTLKGPGTVFRKATINEVSMCVFGADSHTSATAFTQDHNETVTFQVKETAMPEGQQPTAPAAMTAERLKSEFADVHAEILAHGAQAERERFGALQGACGDDTELLVQCFAEGASETEALKRRNERLAQQLAEASKQSAIHVSQTPADPAIAEFKEQVPGKSSADEKQPADFAAAVKAYMSDHNVSEAEAVDKCVDLYPKLHAQMTRGGA